MDRYCVSGDLWDLPEDREIYLKVNFKSIIKAVRDSVIKAEIPSEKNGIYLYQGMTNQYAFYQEKEDNFEQIRQQHYELEQMIKGTIPLSFEFELDLIDEILLCIMQKEDKKERLFLDDAEELNNTMKNTIHNRNKTKSVFPFKETIQSESKKIEIPALGSGVVRLWLGSKKFKNLLAENSNCFEKYKTENLYNMLDNGEKEGVKYSTEDVIILEKILGISTGNIFDAYIMSLLEKECVWKELLGILLEYEGERSRCAIIQGVGFEVYNWQNGIRKMDDRHMAVYVKLLEYYVESYQKIYRNSVETIKKICFSFKNLSAVRECLIERRQEILRFGCPAFALGTICYEKFIKSQYRELLKELKKERTESENIELIQKVAAVSYKIEPFYLECVDEEEKQIFRSRYCEDDRLKLIRNEIIQRNRKKYNF